MLALLRIFTIFPLVVSLTCCYTQSDLVQADMPIDHHGLVETLSYLSSISPPRSHEHPDSLNKAAAFIKQKFIEYGYVPEEQEFDVLGNGYRNIIASWGSRDAPMLVVGAHYDVYGNYPGADDNASGIAGLLELARLIAKHRPELNYRIEFVAYSLEEPPFFRTEHMGSYIHAKSLYDGNSKVIGMVCLEMIGYFTDEKKSQAYPLSLMKLFYPSRGNFIAVVGNYASSGLVKHFSLNLKQTSIDVEKLKAPSFVTGIDFSDHMNYWKFDYEAIMITDTSFYRNPHYHKGTDVVETLNIEKMAQVIQGIYYGLAQIRQ